jgi:hypothetical protein
MDTKKTIGPVRFSYAFVWKPKKNDDGTEKYSVSILWSKKDTKITKMVKAGIKAAIEADANGKRKLKGRTKGIKDPLRDGDIDREGDGAYEGMYFMTANSDRPPGIVKYTGRGEEPEKIVDEREFYSGCHGYVSVNFFAFNEKGNSGIAVGLNHIMKVKDGDPLSGGGTAEAAFADIEIEDEDEDEAGSEFF